MDRNTKLRTAGTGMEHILSSLPSGPVTSIGGRFLATSDVDYYLDMRVVLCSWRAAMDDPKKIPADARFHLREWVMLDEEQWHPRDDETNSIGWLFFNTATGRSLQIDLPRLPDYYFVTSTGGLLILASRSAPHKVLVVNAFTASCIKFKAPIPDSILHTTATLRLAGGTLTLILEHPAGDMAYSATPDDEHFTLLKYTLLDKAHDTLDDLLNRHITAHSFEKYPRCYFLESAGEMLLVHGRKDPGRGMEVFRVNFQKKAIEPMRSIGSSALFLGDRCVSVDANIHPSIEGNCIFYRGRDHHDGRDGIYKYDLMTEKEVLTTSDVVELFGFTRKPVAHSMIQLLVNYCTNIPGSQLENERRYGH